MQMHGFPLGTAGRLLIEARIMPGLQARTHAMHILFDLARRRRCGGAADRIASGLSLERFHIEPEKETALTFLHCRIFGRKTGVHFS
jgi:hypothetical protein